MNVITDQQIIEYVEAHIDEFHDKRLEKVGKLKLSALLKKNPYLFKSKNVTNARDLVKSLADAYLSSQEETLFGGFLEGLAVYAAETTFDGQKSGITGIDLEFSKDNARYIVSIKSGPKWGNSSQVTKLRDNFRSAASTIRQGNLSVHIIPINGCCYGRSEKADRGDYHKYSGQAFWELITDDPDFYTRIIEPLGHEAQAHNDDFLQRYNEAVDRLTRQFESNFCDHAGAIDWNRLVTYNSGNVRPSRLRPAR